MDQIFSWLNTAQASGTFLTIAIISLVVLIIAILIDGIFDFLGGGAIPLEALGAFGTLFGFIGFACIGGGVSIGAATTIGGIIGIIGAVGAWWFGRWFKKGSDTNSATDTKTIVGREAIVTLRIPGGSDLGEIALSQNDLRVTFSAMADTIITAGSTVEITAVISETSVKVKAVS